MTDRVAVIGAGSWGTALALLLAGKGVDVRLWGHRPDHIARLRDEGHNHRYLPRFSFPPSLSVTAALGEALTRADVVVMAVPSHTFRTVFDQVIAAGRSEAVHVSAVKGVEYETGRTMTQVMADCSAGSRGGSPPPLAVLSGPSFAREVAERVPTAITVGCLDDETAGYLQRLFSTEYFRVYTSRDIIGLEISAAAKNVIAIAAGICDGLAFGSNARAALITRGLAEMTRLGTALGAEQQTFFGLSGLGDLVLTCTGALSRNRHVGLELGRGSRLDSILASMTMVAEGVKTTRSLYELVRRLDVETPILDQVYQVLYRGKDCRSAVKDLLDRDLKPERL